MSKIGSPYATQPDAWATATVAGGVLTSVDGVCAKLARTGTGVFTFTLDTQILAAANSYELSVVSGVASTGALPTAYFVADTSNSIKTLTFKDTANAAADVAFLTVSLRLLARN